MFARLFRLSDRFGKLAVKISLWLSDYLITAFKFLSGGLKRQDHDTFASDTHAETQVQSLSGLTVVLLAAVVVLIFWGTNPRSSGSSGIQFIASGQQPQNEAPPVATQPGVVVSQQAPEIRTTGTIAFSMIAGNQEDLFAVVAGQPDPVRLTDSPADDRDPAWSPDGQRLAFSSRRDGNWELYILEMATGSIKRLTYDFAYEGNPSWSPDGLYIAYESYYDGNLNIYLRRSDDDSAPPLPLTQQSGADFDPAWFPQGGGRTLAYVSVRNGVQDIYVISLDDPNDQTAQNLTNTPTVNETDPAWSADGAFLGYAAPENGTSIIYRLSLASGTATAEGQGHSPNWSTDLSQVIYLTDFPFGIAANKSRLLQGNTGAKDLPGLANSPSWTSAPLPPPQGTIAFSMTAPLPTPFVEPVESAALDGPSYRAKTLPGVTADGPHLSDRVDGSFMQLRDHVNQAAGWDFLGRLDSAFWLLNRRVEPGQAVSNWHKAGRAFDVYENYYTSSPSQIELVPEQIGADMYWHLYIRAAVQDGSLGEPLRTLPWDFLARTTGDVQAYEAGGRLRDSIPPGYYVDFTQLALMYGWTRAPSDLLWRSNWPSILFWQYEKRDNLDWWTAMQEIYTSIELEGALSTATPGPTRPVPTSTVPPAVNPRPSSTPEAPQPPTDLPPESTSEPPAAPR